jgi:hypothetical protein
VRISRRGARVALKLPLKTKLLVERIGAEARKEALEESLGITISIV